MTFVSGLPLVPLNIRRYGMHPLLAYGLAFYDSVTCFALACIVFLAFPSLLLSLVNRFKS